MSQQLKVGQVWRSRRGEVIEIVHNDGTSGGHPNEYPFMQKGGSLTYTSSGRWHQDTEDSADLIELIRDVPDSDGWITWNGGECPVPDGTLVDVEYRDGVREFSIPANVCVGGKGRGASPLFWINEGLTNDSIAYRITEQPTKSEQPTPDDAAFLTTATGILAAARNHMIERTATYDKPEGERSMGATVAAFNAITGRDLSEPEGWLLVQILKDVRLFQRDGYHADSAEDCVAYAALKAEAKAREVAK